MGLSQGCLLHSTQTCGSSSSTGCSTSSCRLLRSGSNLKQLLLIQQLQLLHLSAVVSSCLTLCLKGQPRRQQLQFVLLLSCCNSHLRLQLQLQQRLLVAPEFHQQLQNQQLLQHQLQLLQLLPARQSSFQLWLRQCLRLRLLQLIVLLVSCPL